MTLLRLLLLATLLLMGCRAHEHPTAPNGPSEQPDAPAGAFGARGTVPLNWARPVLLILLDDLNLDTFDRALAGGILPTIQSELVDKGVRFTNSFVVNSWCCPSRATLQSGRYSHNNGTFHNGTPLSAWMAWDDANTSLAESLDERGYETARFGKWLNGYTASANSIPPGWDYWAGMYNEANSYDITAYTLRIIDHGAAQSNVTPGTYQEDELAARVASFVASAPNPFYIELTPTSPHIEHTQTGSFTNRTTVRSFRSRPPARWAGSLREDGANGTTPLGGLGSQWDLPGCVGGQRVDFNETDLSDKPAWLRLGPNNEGIHPTITGGGCLGTTGEIATMRRLQLDFYERMRAVDDMVATILAALESRGVLHSTVVIFTSDNGYTMGEHRRTLKQSAYETDIRVPLVIRGAAIGEYAAGQGVVRSEPVLNTDLASTIAELTGGPAFASDGRSLVPLLRGQNPSTWRKAFLVTHWWSDSSSPRTTPLAQTEIPDYRAIRTFDGHAFPNQLYVEYLATGAEPYPGTQNEPPWTQPTAVEVEHYDMTIDPYQADAVTTNPAYAEARSALSAQLLQLTACSGATCRSIENQ